MKGNLKRVITSIMAGSMALSLASCGNSDTSGGSSASAGTEGENKGEVVIHLMMSNSQKTGVSAAVDAFNKAYAGKIRCEADYVAFNDVFETLETLMSNDSTEYDVFAADGPNVAAYVKRGYLKSLNQWFSEDEIKEFSDAMITEGTYQNQFYGAPMGNSSLILYYNKSLLQQAGINIDFDSITSGNRLTWEQLVDYAKQAQKILDPDGTNGIYGIEFQQVGRVYQMNVLPNSLGGAQISSDGLSVDGVINTEPWYTALHWYQDQVNDNVFTRGISADETSSYFMSNKIIFYLGTTALPTAFANNNFSDYGYTYVPCFKGHEKDLKTSCGSWTLGLNVHSTKQDAAAEFIKYLTLGDGADVYINASGMVPALTRQFTEDLAQKMPYMKIAEYEVEHTALVRAITPAYNEYSTSLNALWDNVRNGADVEDSVQNCVNDLNTAFLEYK